MFGLFSSKKETKENLVNEVEKTEEIVEVIFSDPKLTIYGILFGITYVLGVYLWKRL